MPQLNTSVVSGENAQLESSPISVLTVVWNTDDDTKFAERGDSQSKLPRTYSSVTLTKDAAERLRWHQGAYILISWFNSSRCLGVCRVVPSNGQFAETETRMLNVLKRKVNMQHSSKSSSLLASPRDSTGAEVSAKVQEAQTVSNHRVIPSTCCSQCQLASPEATAGVVFGVSSDLYPQDADYALPSWVERTSTFLRNSKSKNLGSVNKTFQVNCGVATALKPGDSFAVAKTLNLRLISAKQVGLVQTEKTKTVKIIETLQQKRNLWQVYDLLHAPSSLLLLKDCLANGLVLRNNSIQLFLMGLRITFLVTSIAPASAATAITNDVCAQCSTSYPCPIRVPSSVELFLEPPSQIVLPKNVPNPYGVDKKVGFARVGGYDSVLDELRDMLVIPLVCPSLFSSLGIACPKGVLLYGPPGTGKTHLARALAEELEYRWPALLEQFHYLSPGSRLPPVIEILSASEVVAGGETAVQALFERCRQRQSHSSNSRSTLLFVDEIDTLCPNRETSGDAERRVVSAFLTELDGLQSGCQIVLLAATNRPNAIDPALRRAGRIDREVEIDVPSADNRVAILSTMVRDQLDPDSTLTTEAIRDLAFDCHAFVAADLKNLCTMAGIYAIRDAIRTKEAPKVALYHFREALKHIKPSAMKEVAVEVPHVQWNDIGGYDIVKQKLKECVEWPLKFRELFLELGTTPPRGILLYGPPGCSKTLLAKAVATESRMNFIAVKGPELFSKWVGESERAVRDVFRKARQNSPCVIFFDEIDALGGDRQSGAGGSGVEARVLSQMLNEMDGINPVKQVVIIAATNRPDLLDAALIRPGRLDRLVYVPLPDMTSREAIFRVHLPPNTTERHEWSRRLSALTEGYSGAELAMICREAAMLALRETISEHDSSTMMLLPPKSVDGAAPAAKKAVAKVTWGHLEKSLRLVRPRITASLVHFYETYTDNLNL